MLSCRASRKAVVCVVEEKKTSLFQELFSDLEKKIVKSVGISSIVEQSGRLNVESCFEMDDLVEELGRRVEIQKQKQREHEDYVLSYVDSFLGLMTIVRGKYRLDETKVKALKKIRELFSKEAYEYALEVYRGKSK
jgi:hypothetical protein